MKKVAIALLACACAPCFALDWDLPVLTMKYELAHGSREDAEEELLLPSSLRNTVSLRLKEAADPAIFELTLRYSLKDYFLATGDYGSVELEHEQTWRMSDLLKIGFSLGAKNVDFPEPDEEGLPKGYLSLRAGTSATVQLARGTHVEGGLSARYDLAGNEAKAFQAYVVSTALVSRLDNWQLTARYRGEFRLPLGEASVAAGLSYNTCSLTLQWDPN